MKFIFSELEFNTIMNVAIFGTTYFSIGRNGGANFRIIENGVSGFLVNSEDEWLIQLGNLLSDSDLRSRIGKNGRDRVQHYYSV